MHILISVLVTNVYTQFTAFAIAQNCGVCSSKVVPEDFTFKEVLQGSYHGLSTFFQSSKEINRDSR